MKRFFSHTVLLTLILVLSLNFCAFANADTAGNFFSDSDEEELSDIQRDLYKVGQTVEFSSLKIGGSAFLAGRDINIADSEIAGSLRTAEQTLTVTDSKIGGNITVVGQNLTFTNVTVGGVYALGQNFNFSGEADGVSIIAANVVLGASIHGNAEINAGSVTLADDLVVEGKLSVSAADEPELPASAKITSFVYSSNRQSTDGFTMDANEYVNEYVNEYEDEYEDMSSDSFISITTSIVPVESPVVKMLKFLVNAVILGLALCLICGPKNIAKPAQLMLDKPGATFGFGFLALFLFPIIIIALVFSPFTSYSAGLLTAVFTVICIFARAFTGISLAAALLQKFSKNAALSNPWLDSVIGALVFALLSKVPYLGIIITVGSLLISLGCFVQYVVRNLRSGKKTNKSEPAAEQNA